MDQNPDGKAMIDYFVSIDILCNLNNHRFMLFLIKQSPIATGKAGI